MVRLTALAAVTATLMCVAAYQLEKRAVEPQARAEQYVAKSSHVYGPSCQTQVGGKIVQLQLGQGIETADGWRNCQIHDGHSLIIYSSKPPRSAAMQDDG